MVLLGRRACTAGPPTIRPTPGGRYKRQPCLRDFVLLYLASLAFAVANGLATGGSLSHLAGQAVTSKSQSFSSSSRPPFAARLTRALVGGSWWRRRCQGADVPVGGLLRPIPPQAEIHMTTNHGDSILLSWRSSFWSRATPNASDRRRLNWLLLLVPLIVWAMVANKRRLAWVELAMGLAAVYYLSPWSAVEERPPGSSSSARQSCSSTSPWAGTPPGRSSAPVKVLRSLRDAKQDASTYWREVENWNIAMTMREQPRARLRNGQGVPRVHS